MEQVSRNMEKNEKLAPMCEAHVVNLHNEVPESWQRDIAEITTIGFEFKPEDELAEAA